MRRWIRAGRLEADYVGGKRGYRLRWRLIRAILDADTPNEHLESGTTTEPPRAGADGCSLREGAGGRKLEGVST